MIVTLSCLCGKSTQLFPFDIFLSLSRLFPLHSEMFLLIRTRTTKSPYDVLLLTMFDSWINKGNECEKERKKADICSD